MFHLCPTISGSRLSGSVGVTLSADYKRRPGLVFMAYKRLINQIFILHKIPRRSPKPCSQTLPFIPHDKLNKS